MNHTVSRRAFLATLAVGLPFLGMAQDAIASAPSASPAAMSALAPRELRFLHTHTGERLTVEYFQQGEYLPDALSTVNRFLRDFRTGEVHEIDAGLLDLLHTLTNVTGTSKPFQVISGFRSPKTNAMLRQHSEGVAAGSLHMVGQAIDIRLSDIPLPKLRSAALSVKRGGVGYYPASDFVHVDTGRVRFW